MQLALGLMATLGFVGGALAWRNQTKRMRWRSLIFDESPSGVSVRDHHRRRISRARLSRLGATAGCSALGVTVGLVVSLFLR
jgi:hypothetical protein